MSGENESTHIRINKEVKEKLDAFINDENKTISEVIAFLLYIEAEYRKIRQDLQAQERERIGLEMLESEV